MLLVNFRFTEYSTQHEKTTDVELWWGEETCIHLLVITFFHVGWRCWPPPQLLMPQNRLGLTLCHCVCSVRFFWRYLKCNMAMWNNYLQLVRQTTFLFWVSSVTDESSHFMTSKCRPNIYNSKATAFFQPNSAVNNLMKILYLCFRQVLFQKKFV